MIETDLVGLMEQFDTFLLDQFGVLLDGSRAYPDAPAALAELSRRGKRVGILTNSGKRAGPNLARLAKMGFDPGDITAVISSGEAAHAVLVSRIGDTVPKGGAVLLLSRDDDRSAIDGLDLTMTENANEADLILIAGSQGDDLPLDHYRALLERAARRGTPALCTNPDMKMLTSTGLTFGAGQIAATYREMGGPVEEIGKPHPLIYQVALERLGAQASDVVCVGDSPAHDIRGAHGVGCQGALTRTGIHADAPVETVLDAAPATDLPDFVIPGFCLTRVKGAP